MRDPYRRIGHATPSARMTAPQLYRRPADTKLKQPSLHQKHCDPADSSQEIYGIGRIGGLPIRQRERDEVVSKLAPQISASVSAAHRYGGSSDITPELSIMDSLTSRSGMDTLSVEAFTRNGPSGRWTITRGRIVVVTLAGLYYAEQGRVLVVTCRDPCKAEKLSQFQVPIPL